MLFGANNEKGIRFNTDSFELEVIDASTNIEQVLRHDVTNRAKAQLLVDLAEPVALGVVYKNTDNSSFEQSWHGAPGNGLRRSRSIKDLLRGANSWTVG